MHRNGVYVEEESRRERRSTHPNVIHDERTTDKECRSYRYISNSGMFGAMMRLDHTTVIDHGQCIADGLLLLGRKTFEL